MDLLKTCSGAYLMILNNVFYLYIYKKILGYLKYMSILAYIEDIWFQCHTDTFGYFHFFGHSMNKIEQRHGILGLKYCISSI